MGNARALVVALPIERTRGRMFTVGSKNSELAELRPQLRRVKLEASLDKQSYCERVPLETTRRVALVGAVKERDQLLLFG